MDSLPCSRTETKRVSGRLPGRWNRVGSGISLCRASTAMSRRPSGRLLNCFSVWAAGSSGCIGNCLRSTFKFALQHQHAQIFGYYQLPGKFTTNKCWDEVSISTNTHNCRANAMLSIPFVVSLSNHELNQLVRSYPRIVATVTRDSLFATDFPVSFASIMTSSMSTACSATKQTLTYSSLDYKRNN